MRDTFDITGAEGSHYGSTGQRIRARHGHRVAEETDDISRLASGSLYETFKYAIHEGQFRLAPQLSRALSAHLFLQTRFITAPSSAIHDFPFRFRHCRYAPMDRYNGYMLGISRRLSFAIDALASAASNSHTSGIYRSTRRAEYRITADAVTEFHIFSNFMRLAFALQFLRKYGNTALDAGYARHRTEHRRLHSISLAHYIRLKAHSWPSRFDVFIHGHAFLYYGSYKFPSFLLY